MHHLIWLGFTVLGLASCGLTMDERGEAGGGFGGLGPPSSDDGAGPGSGGGDGGGDGGGGGGDSDGNGGDGDGGDFKFDVASDYDVLGGAGDPGEDAGCEKVDFLFVVDNSGSMADEQQNLITSFPGFISTIQQTLEAQDYHVMAIDTDEGTGSNCQMGCYPGPSCCVDYCATNPTCTCNNQPCTPPNDQCDMVLGAGRNDNVTGDPCNIAGDNRYMVDGQPDLTATFDCAARVGAGGDGDERQMQAMIEATSTLSQPGRCNEGFVRDDAILVVTVITDEEDDPNDPNGEDTNSPGDPSDWFQAMVEIKNGDPRAVVVLALVGDTDLPGAVCQPMNGNVGAEPAPRLREFSESFTYGQWCSVCSPDYTPCFEEAVSIIDSACSEFRPPG